MQFLVISTPRPERPSDMRGPQTKFWDWIKPLQARGTVQSCHIKVGRGACVVFDVADHETLHRLVNEWADCVPAAFEIIALVDPAFQERRARGL